MNQPEKIQLKPDLLEETLEELKDVINILQLLSVELSVNEDDEHILRSISVVEKMLQSTVKNLQQKKSN